MRVARQGFDDLQAFGAGAAEKIAELALAGAAFDERIEAGAGPPVGKGDNRDVADLGMGFQTRGDLGRLADETHAAALAIGHADAAGDGVIDFFAGRHPYAGDPGLACKHAALGGSERRGRITALVLEQMPQILITREAEQPAAAGGNTRRAESR